MGMWTIMEEGRDEYGRDFGMKVGNAEAAYQQGFEEGCRHGYKKAMMEVNGGEMGYRGNYGGGQQSMGNRSYGGGSYGNRMPGYLPEDPWPDDDMGERRRRRANGQFY